MHLRRATVIESALLFLCALAVLKSSADLGRILLLEARGAINSDAHLYFTVGRGMLNGLKPYSDLFESKPPGMFFLAASSLLLMGDERLALFLQLAIFTLIPLLLAWFAWRECGADVATSRKAIIASCAFIMGIYLSLLLEEDAGGIQTESFGSFFALLYFLCVLRFGPKNPHVRTAVLSLLLLCTLGLKEPFLLTVLAGLLILPIGTKQWLRDVLLPLGIAALTGALLLTLFGYLGPYLHIYLPSMLLHRIGQNPLEPLWIRSMSVGRVLGNIALYATAPLLGCTLAFIWTGIPAFKKHAASPIDFNLSIVTSIVGFFAIMMTFDLSYDLHAKWLGAALRQSVLPIPVTAYVLLLALFIGLLVVQWHHRLFWHQLSSLSALCLSATAIGLAVYAKNQFAFAVPMYFAVAVLFTRVVARSSAPQYFPAVVVILLLSTTFLYRPNENQLGVLRDFMGYRKSDNAFFADKADALLDACAIDRYVGINTYRRMAFARHSPYGPLFHMDFYKFLGLDHPLYGETLQHIANDAQIIIVYQNGWPQGLQASDLSPIYTTDAPDCAKPFLPLPDSQVYFRRPV